MDEISYHQCFSGKRNASTSDCRINFPRERGKFCHFPAEFLFSPIRGVDRDKISFNFSQANMSTSEGTKIIKNYNDL